MIRRISIITIVNDNVSVAFAQEWTRYEAITETTYNDYTFTVKHVNKEYPTGADNGNMHPRSPVHIPRHLLDTLAHPYVPHIPSDTLSYPYIPLR